MPDLFFPSIHPIGFEIILKKHNNLVVSFKNVWVNISKFLQNGMYEEPVWVYELIHAYSTINLLIYFR